MHETLIILKKRQSLLEAQQMASQEFVAFFNVWHDYIIRMTGAPVRLLYAAEGLNAWIIRVDVEAREEKLAEIKRWTIQHVESDRLPGIGKTPVWEGYKTCGS